MEQIMYAGIVAVIFGLILLAYSECKVRSVIQRSRDEVWGRISGNMQTFWLDFFGYLLFVCGTFASVFGFLFTLAAK